ncbi:T3SS (YopN, CesT) and YbjN peptide-binding chaperone 1 [Salsipaludibacter albus]|uniref:T3SS (YopN, CesT) and YbjN peptide-binding chaperone 1 n=1 Tax=Salsipaludibacter albus TaxID=2849650 RepID=UPI001EE4E744|nr:hypothetical protein [Salsipaludibacter albus]MBY5161845.1 hypothetical protein [Salsipaludibacter albus]
MDRPPPGPVDPPEADAPAAEEPATDGTGVPDAADVAAEGEGPADEPGRNSPVAVAPGGAGVRPPRRTGIFVDPEDLREHVGALLRTMLGTYQVDPFGNFSFLHDGARVFVTIGMGPMGPHVGVYSVTNIDLDLSAELGSFLATTNHRLGFGTLSYDTDNRAVWLRHTLLGTALDAPELQAAVASVARTAATIDDEIGDRFGGRTFGDAPADVQDSTTPPTEDTVNVTGYL